MPGAKSEPNGNALRAWFEKFPRPMFRKDFAQLAGISHSYLSQLCSDRPPWPSRDVAAKIEEITSGEVTIVDFVGMAGPERRQRAA